MIDLYSSNIKRFKLNLIHSTGYDYDLYVRDVERDYIYLKYGYKNFIVLYFYRFKTKSVFILLFKNHDVIKIFIPSLIFYYSSFPIGSANFEYVYKRKNGTIHTKLTSNFSLDSNYKIIKRGYVDGFNNKLIFSDSVKVVHSFNRCLVGLGIRD
jgi:hypothetical protein